jgi:Zn-dependent peptidase ImmA (M78 family)
MELKKEIKDYVQDLAADCYKDYSLQLKKILKKLKLSYFEGSFDDDTISGVLMKNKDDDSYEIIVNDKHSLKRKRFTAAHEIGHYISFLKNSYSKEWLENNSCFEDHVFFRKDSDQSRAETEANEIAAELVMPKRVISQFFYEGKTIEEISQIFVVSAEAVSVRLITLGFLKATW